MAKLKHEKHECMFCGAVYLCEPARKLRGMKLKCRAPFYWPCPECFLSDVWQDDPYFKEHMKIHTEAWRT